MSTNGSQNGHAAEPGCWLRLDYDPATGRLAISGAVPTLETARHMLNQAGWEYEAQWRQERAKQFAQELREQGKVAALSESIFGKRM